MTPEITVMTLMVIGVCVQTAYIILLVANLGEWKRRAIIAETEVKHMNAVYGPHHKG